MQKHLWVALMIVALAVLGCRDSREKASDLGRVLEEYEGSMQWGTYAVRSIL